ncbi:hypothetical protein BGW42_008569 [Actinomortierella wolfii]|nr:hypothetical protein BGW42_008569 [Actinomortierella wolfii]
MFSTIKARSVVALGAGAGLLATLSKPVVHAEGKDQRVRKLPVYDDPEPEMVVKEEPTRLDEAIKVARQETDRQILGMKTHLQMVTNKVVDVEKEVESTVKSVLVKEEEVMPAAIYVIVAGFAGSIFAKRRNVVLRFLTPVAFSAMAFGYFFPKSSNRLIERASKSDLAKYLPADLQQQVRQFTQQSESQLVKAVEEVKQSVQEAKDTLEKTEKKAEKKVAEVIQKTEQKVKEITEDTRKNV